MNPIEDSLENLWSKLTMVTTLEDRIFGHDNSIDSPLLEYTFNSAPPTSLDNYLDLYLKNDGTYSDVMYVWHTESDAVVRLESGIERHVDDGVESVLPVLFAIALHDCLERRKQMYILVYASSKEDAVVCMEYLLRLSSDKEAYPRVEIWPMNNMRVECLFSKSALIRWLENETRKVSFTRFGFAQDHVRVLLTEGKKEHNLYFADCRFHDVPVDMNWDHSRGPVGLILKFQEEDPFSSADNWIKFLSVVERSGLEYLELHDGRLRDIQVCQALAATSVQELTLSDLEMADGGSSIIDAVLHGRGARKLEFFHAGPIRSQEQWQSFFNALRGNNHLQSLTIFLCELFKDDWLSLATALSENQGLRSLDITAATVVDEECYSQLLFSIEDHPCLRKLRFRDCHDGSRQARYREENQRRVQRVSDLLSKNTILEYITAAAGYPNEDWKLLVTPKLQRNLYLKRSKAIQAILQVDFRGAVLAAGLAHVSTEPSLLWLLVSTNQDVVLESFHSRKQEHLDDSNAERARKRLRSASFDKDLS